MKKYKKRNSMSTLATKYYEGYSERWARELMKADLEHVFGHHLSLKKRIKRKGWSKCRGLSHSVLTIIKKRLGDL